MRAHYYVFTIFVCSALPSETLSACLLSPLLLLPPPDLCCLAWHSSSSRAATAYMLPCVVLLRPFHASLCGTHGWLINEVRPTR